MTGARLPATPPPGAAPARPGSAPGDRATALLRGALLLLAVVTVVQAGLGFMGLLGAAPTVLGALALLGTVGLIAAAARDSRSPLFSPASSPAPAATPASVTAPRAAPWTALDCAGAAALAAALGERIWTGLHRSTFLYDVLSYHLHLPAGWRAAGRLYLMPTPFGDPAAAYAPSNAALFYHLALATTGNARLAHAGQIPFAALAVLAVYTTARLRRASRAAGFAAALAFLLIPEIWQQAPTAMADLATAAFFLAAIPFLLRLRTGPIANADLLGLGLALGLLLGTKYISMMLAVPLLIWMGLTLFRRLPPARLAVALALLLGLMFACGGFWYLRNTLLTGNPLFPATLTVGPWILAHGLYDAALMRTSEYHLPVTDVKALLAILSESGWGFLGALAVAIAATRPWRWLALAVLVLAINWLVIPYQQSRFFFSFWGTLTITLALTPALAPRAGAVALLAATGGSILQWATSGRLLLPAAAIAGAVGGPWLGAALARLWALSRLRAPRAATVRAACAVLAGAAVITTIAWARAHPATGEYAVGDGHDAGWSWVSAHGRPAGHRIAYAGSNLPLPLWGKRFENDVRYVGVAGGPSRAGASLSLPLPLRAPSSSWAPHHFLNVPAAVRGISTAEPEPERAAPVREVWLSNLQAFNIDLVFLAAMYPGVQQSIAHDSDGFPIERSWADAQPRIFRLLFATPEIRIYAFNPQAPPDQSKPSGSAP